MLDSLFDDIWQQKGQKSERPSAASSSILPESAAQEQNTLTVAVWLWHQISKTVSAFVVV
jgi:hypothetical protein